MQKHAYLTKFELLPISGDLQVYFDDYITNLPYADNFPLLHYHSCYELGLCLKGEGVFLSEGHYATLSVGDVVFIPPGDRHYSRSLHQNDPCLCRFWYLTEEMLPATQLPPVLHPAEYPELARLIADTPIQNGQAARFRLRAFLAEAAGLFPAAAAPVRPTASAAEEARLSFPALCGPYNRYRAGSALPLERKPASPPIQCFLWDAAYGVPKSAAGEGRRRTAIPYQPLGGRDRRAAGLFRSLGAIS